MSLLHPALLLGLLFAVIPVALHLLLRARPKTLVFPALRLLQQRRMQNQRRLRLRHLWLLLLRMAIIAALVILVARPSLPPANYAPSLREGLVFAAIGVIALAAYFAIMHYWQRQQTPTFQLLTRRTYLRGGLGLATAILALLLVAWPYQRRVSAELTAPAPAAVSNLPVAAVFLCDTSLSMTYLFEGGSRLEAARKIALEQLERLPAGSQAAVLGPEFDAPPVMTPDLSVVQNRLEALTPQAIQEPLNRQLERAIRFQQDERRRTLGAQATIPEDRRQDQFVREIYLLTDLAKSAWKPDESQTLKILLEEQPWLGVYLIDVGIERPVNTGVVDLRLSRQMVGHGGQTTIEATVRQAGPPAAKTVVELWQGNDGQPLSKRDQQTVDLSTSSSTRVLFPCEANAGTLIQGELRIVGADPLAIDDTSQFSIGILPPLKIRVVATNRGIAKFWIDALQGLRAVGSAYEVEFVASDRWSTAPLEGVDVICLTNLDQPTEAEWKKLAEFAESGGGVLLFLGAPSRLGGGRGERIDPTAYSTAAAQTLLPVVPKASLKFANPQQLNFRDIRHPLTTRLETLGVLSGLGEVEFQRYWSVELQPQAVTLARWTDEAAQPAFVLRDVGRGRCGVFTSSVDSVAWSNWPQNWTFLVLADQWLQLLSRQASSRHTVWLGDAISLPLNVSGEGDWLLRLPDLTQRRLDVDRARREVDVTDALQIGNYQIAQAAAATRVVTGFSVNLPAAESDLTRWTTSELDELLGTGRYSLARDPEQLTKLVLTGRFGQEVSGLLLALLVVIFVVEQVTSTWFYQQDTAPATG